MKKHYFVIDFEVVDLNIWQRFLKKKVFLKFTKIPFSFSICHYKKGKKIFKNQILNFKINLSNLSLTKLKKKIKETLNFAVKNLLGDFSFEISENNSSFICWNKLLEEEIIKMIFLKITIEEIKYSKTFSLKKIDNKSFNVNLFKYFKKINKTLNLIPSKYINKNGFIANAIGFLFFIKENDSKNKVLQKIKINWAKLQNEIKEYNNDDLSRIINYLNNQKSFQTHIERTLTTQKNNEFNFKILQYLEILRTNFEKFWQYKFKNTSKK
ncbi:hypothetical protein [Mycoplasmopsis columbina]|nr:hypothetical protein [Mycoplasmopsis columbina]